MNWVGQGFGISAAILCILLGVSPEAKAQDQRDETSALLRSYMRAISPEHFISIEGQNGEGQKGLDLEICPSPQDQTIFDILNTDVAVALDRVEKYAAPSSIPLKAKELLTLGELHGQVNTDSASNMRGLIEFLKEAELTHLQEALARRNIHIAEPLPTDSLTRPLLAYLYLYFELFDYRASKKIVLQSSDQNGPQLVKKTENENSIELSFGLNSDEDLFLKNLANLLDKQTTVKLSEVNNSQDTPKLEFISKNGTHDNWSPPNLRNHNSDNKTVVVYFDNTLFEQLSLHVLSREQLKKFAENEYQFKIDASASEKLHDFSSPMTSEEIMGLIKSLSDLPKHVVHALALDRVVRMQPGYTSISNPRAAADYNPITRTIRMMDGAYSGRATQGEGTFIHELAHALWVNLPQSTKLAWFELSWECQEDLKLPTNDNCLSENFRAKPDESDFVSAYSQKSPEEDFAEHFSAYVNDPELILNKAEKKLMFLHEHIFPHTGYATTAAANVQHYVHSEDPDTQPPYLTEPVKNAVQFEVSDSEEDVKIKCTIQGLFDDKSGITKVAFCLRPDPSTSADPFEDSVFVHFTDEDVSNPKQGVYQTTAHIPKRELYTGDYQFDFGILTDKAGNDRHLSGGNMPVSIIGTKQMLRKRDTPSIEGEERQKMITLTQLEGNDRYFQISLPTDHTKDLGEVQIFWLHDDESESRHLIKQNGYSWSHFSSTIGSENLVATISFAEEYNSDKARMTNIIFQYDETEEFPEEVFHINMSNKLDNLALKLPPSSQADTSEPHIELNDIQLSAFTEENSKNRNKEGGDTTIHLTLPVSGIEFDKNHSAVVDVFFRSPTGIMLYSEIKIKDDMKRYVDPVTGVAYFDVPFPLKTNHEEGIYILESLEIQEKYPGSQKYGSRISEDTIRSQFTPYKLSEREITRAIEVKRRD